MKYYCLAKDESERKPLELKNYKMQEKNDLSGLVVYEEFTRATKMVDYIQKRYLFKTNHIVSDMVKEVFSAYDQDLKSNVIFVIDPYRKEQYVYWEVKFDPVDCLEYKKAMTFKNMELNRSKMNGKKIFSVDLEKQNYLIVRFDVAESIMKRLPLGIIFLDVKMV